MVDPSQNIEELIWYSFFIDGLTHKQIQEKYSLSKRKTKRIIERVVNKQKEKPAGSSHLS